MIYSGQLFKYRKFDFDKLCEFGFKKDFKSFVLKTKILEGFELTVKIFEDGKIDTKIIETLTEEEYNLVYVNGVQGEFVGKIKEALEDKLLEIKEKCTVLNVFKTKCAHLIIDYVKEKYGDEPEYLWKKFPNNAIFRKKDNSKTGGKWYAAILTAKRKSIGLNGEGEIEIIDLKAQPDKIDEIIKNKGFFRAYHMNKKHWITIILDGTVKIDEIKKRIDESYKLL